MKINFSMFMKKRNLFLFCLIGVLCNSCITSDLRNVNTDMEWDFKEILTVPDSVSLQFGRDYNGGKMSYKFSIDPDKDSLFTGIIKLNSFSITLEKGGTPISYQTVQYMYYGDTILNDYRIEKINTLPFMWHMKDKKEPYFTIYIEYNISERKIKQMFVNYDIEIGNKRIVRTEIEYKKKWFIDLPH